MNRSLAMPLVILSILAGMVHGYSRYQVHKKNRMENLPPHPAVHNPPVQPATKPDSVTPPPKPSPGKEKTPSSQETLKEIFHFFNLAGASFEGMDYLEAEKLLRKGLQLLYNLKSKAPSTSTPLGSLEKLEKMMDRLLKRSIVYYSLIRDMDPRKKEDLHPLYLIEYYQGGTSIGVRYKQIQGQAVFTLLFSPIKKGFAERLKEGEKIFIPQKEVRKATSITYEEYQKLGEEWAEKEARRFSPDDFMNYYRLVYLCVRNRIFRPVSLLLTQVLRGKNGILLLEAFANHPKYKIQELKNFWLYGEMQKGLPIAAIKPKYPPTSPNPPPKYSGNGSESGFSQTGSSQSSSAGTSPNPNPATSKVTEKKVTQIPKDLQEIMEKARKVFQEGMEYYKQIYIHRNPQKRQAYIHKALEGFRKAYALYDQVAQKEPDLAGLEETMNRLSTLIYDCQKMLNF